MIMQLIYARYNKYQNSIGVTTFNGYLLRIDCGMAEHGHRLKVRLIRSVLWMHWQNLFISKYELYLPNREELKKLVDKIMFDEEN